MIITDFSSFWMRECNYLIKLLTQLDFKHFPLQKKKTKKTTGAQFSLGSCATLNMRARGDGSCSAPEDGEEEEVEKGGEKGTGSEEKNPSKLQTSWNNSSRQRERGLETGR